MIWIFSFGFASADSLGQQVEFYVDSGYDTQGRSQITATLQAMGDYVYFYVADDFWALLPPAQQTKYRQRLQNLAEEFDNVIYPKERAIFGSEWTPGIDNDKRITILVTSLVNDAGGYIRMYDEYSKSLFAYSNEREMFYISALYIFDDKIKAYIAHEFQHLITHYQKTVLYNLEEDVWLNEARSEYAPTLCGYDNVYLNSNLSERVELFLDSPSDSLTDWRNQLADYGVVSIFLHYLVDHYGEPILTKMMLNNQIGIASINQALAELGEDENFNDIYQNWVIANYLNDCSLGSEKQYCYLDKNLNYQRLNVGYTTSYSGFPNLTVERSSALKSWSPYWYRFRSAPDAVTTTEKDTFIFEFEGQTTRGNFNVPYIILGDGTPQIGEMSLVNQKGKILVDDFISKDKILLIIPYNQYKTSDFDYNEPEAAFTFRAYSSEESESEKIMTITSIVPNSGPVSGGTRVIISGSGFTEDATVKFGSSPATNVVFINSHTIEATTPSFLSGRVDVTVSSPDGTSAALNGFDYLKSNQSYPNGSLLRAYSDKKVYVIEGNYKRWIQTAQIFNAYGHLRWEDIIDVEQSVLDQYQEAWLIRAANDFRVYEVNSDGTKHWINMSAEQFTQSGRLWDMIFIVNSYERDFYRNGPDVYFTV